MRSSRRDVLSGTAAVLLTTAKRDFAQLSALTPEQFGAVGDGRTNDTAAFAAMAAFVNQRGGGEITLRPVTYIVGGHVRDEQHGYPLAPTEIMNFVGCTRPLIVRGNGARLRCAPGLRYGTFDPVTGRATKHRLPFYGVAEAVEAASPYRAMISAEKCSGSVEIRDLELDGNLSALVIGGPYGDTGWQIACFGLRLASNSGNERVVRVYSHHHAQDGLYIDGSPDRAAVSVFENVYSEYNVRQGCSFVAGRGYTFVNCRFNHTGKARMKSAPAAGFDIEAEVRKIRDLRFVGCEFSNNVGAGLVADSGDSEGALFESCRFVGTTNWAAWPNKPRFRFNKCEFVGSIVRAFGSTDPQRAAQFHDCVFRDDPALSPTGEVYNALTSHPIAELPSNPNVLFNRCRFLLTHRAVLPWTTNVVIFSDCVMSQKAEKQAYPRGTFLGRNIIEGNVGLYSARVLGELIVNGKVIPRTV